MDDTRARFLTAIADRLGADRVVELHLFSPIRQGVVETGVAVVAVTRGGDEVGSGCGEGKAEDVGEEEGAIVVSEAAEAVLATEEPAAAGPSDVVWGSLASDDAEPSPYADDALPAPAVHDDRLVVFTARYRLTRKGPDRGKWLFECGATADAPLATVDAVARGVTQRSKDLTETERLSGDQLRTLLQDPAWRVPA